MHKGVLYGIGVGPGDPRLMTLLAVETIERCPVVAAPRTAGGGMVALDIARGAVDLSGKTILPLDFVMSRDPAKTARAHAAAAALLRGELDAGRSVAMLNLGDVSIFASFRYLADILRPEGYRIEMIPGVPSFCAAAALLGATLTDLDKPLRIVPDGYAVSNEELAREGTTVLMKSGRRLPKLLDDLRRRGLIGKTMAAQNCGLPNQRLYPHLNGDSLPDDYFTVVIVRGEGDGSAPEGRK